MEMVGTFWQYYTSYGFENFSPKENKKLEGFYDIYKNDKEKFQFFLPSSKFSFSIDFSNMTITTLQTWQISKLKRKSASNSMVIWEIKYLDKELWLPFSEEISDWLETKYQRNPKVPVQIEFRGIKFTLNLNKKTHDYNHLGYKYENLRRIELPQLSPEIVEMVPFIYSKKMEIASIQIKYPLLTKIGSIKEILKIKNPFTKQRYNYIKTKFNFKEKLLFHGTKQIYLSRIIIQGLLLPNNQDGMLGRGIYLAIDPRKANQYCDPENKIILMVKVLKSKENIDKKQNMLYKEYSFKREDILYLKYVIFYS